MRKHEEERSEEINDVAEEKVEETPKVAVPKPVKGPIRLNLGSGYRKMEGFVNIDNRKETNPDLLCDVTTGLPYKDGEVLHVRAYDFLEHVPQEKAIALIEEIYRVLQVGGLLEHFTPSTDGRGAFQDLNHRSFWNFNSWLYFTDDAYRQLYGTKAKFKIITLENKVMDSQLNIIHTFGVLEKV